MADKTKISNIVLASVLASVSFYLITNRDKRVMLYIYCSYATFGPLSESFVPFLKYCTVPEIGTKV